MQGKILNIINKVAAFSRKYSQKSNNNLVAAAKCLKAKEFKTIVKICENGEIIVQWIGETAKAEIFFNPKNKNSIDSGWNIITLPPIGGMMLSGDFSTFNAQEFNAFVNSCGKKVPKINKW